MRIQWTLAMLVAVSAATPLTFDNQSPKQLENRQLGGKGKAKSGKGGVAPAEAEPGSSPGNTAMKNGWQPSTKAPAGKSEPCLSPDDCDYSHLVMNELIDGQCRAITFIFARATTELGNMGAAAGSGVARYLTGHYGTTNVAVQGVTYPADIAGNMASGGCAAAGIKEAVRLFNLANTKCPNTIIVAGGYSQGTACMHSSIPKVPTDVKKKIVGVVLFGDTRATQSGRKIEGMDSSKVKIYCNSGDAVCTGSLVITQAHFKYTPSVAPATQFLITHIDAAKPKLVSGATVGLAGAAVLKASEE